jgi:hypothetical protein
VHYKKARQLVKHSKYFCKNAGDASLRASWGRQVDEKQASLTCALSSRQRPQRDVKYRNVSLAGSFWVKTSDTTAWTVTHENGAAFNVGTFPRLAESSVGQLGC